MPRPSAEISARRTLMTRDEVRHARILDALCAALLTRCSCGRPVLSDLSVGEAAALIRAAGCLVSLDYKR